MKLQPERLGAVKDCWRPLGHVVAAVLLLALVAVAAWILVGPVAPTCATGQLP